MKNSATYLWRWLAAVCLACSEAAAQSEPGPTRRIVVSLTDRRLLLILDGRVVRSYPVAVGTPETPTPAGTFQIANLVHTPAWYQSGKVVRPGPQNPLGPRWIGLSRKGYGIHGTNRPHSIGGAKSHGCIRMRNNDVKELFDAITVGDIVELRAGPIETGSWY
jgi:lipoprotein-anchoring transpeptidase ErfK/SrfK